MLVRHGGSSIQHDALHPLEGAALSRAVGTRYVASPVKLNQVLDHVAR
jgi:hypothetical protein